jgi:hypothetical protein
MHFKLIAALAAVAPVLGSPLSVPRDEASDAAAQLAAISQLAYNATVEDVASPNSKRSPGAGACTLKNLRVRREW